MSKNRPSEGGFFDVFLRIRAIFAEPPILLAKGLSPMVR